MRKMFALNIYVHFNNEFFRYFSAAATASVFVVAVMRSFHYNWKFLFFMRKRFFYGTSRDAMNLRKGPKLYNVTYTERVFISSVTIPLGHLLSHCAISCCFVCMSIICCSVTLQFARIMHFYCNGTIRQWFHDRPTCKCENRLMLTLTSTN